MTSIKRKTGSAFKKKNGDYQEEEKVNGQYSVCYDMDTGEV